MTGRVTQTRSSSPSPEEPLRPVLAEGGRRAVLARGLRVKVCGLTRPEDARSAYEGGADYLGLVFANSARHVEPRDAARLIEAVPRARWVGVFAGWEVGRTLAMARALGLSTVQLHGDEAVGTAQELSSAGAAFAGRFPSGRGVMKGERSSSTRFVHPTAKAAPIMRITELSNFIMPPRAG